MTSAAERRHTSPEFLEALHSGDKTRGLEIVHAYVRQCEPPSTTADECCEALGWGHNSTAPRLTDLEHAGLVVKPYDAAGNRVRRRTRAKCFAGVVVAIEFAPRHAKSQASLFGDLTPEPTCPD
jgi:hypothetical protein